MKLNNIKSIYLLGLALIISISASAQSIVIYDPVNNIVVTNAIITQNLEGNSVVSGLKTEDLNDNYIYQVHAYGYRDTSFTKATSIQNAGLIIIMPGEHILNEITVTASRSNQYKSDIPSLVQTISQKDIQTTNAANTAYLVQNSGYAYVQMSQMGGGSPVMRGFEANKLILAVDGIRLNNAIYRAGHLQDLITVDGNTVDRIEMLFGPSSLMYGSDALGGVIHLITPSPKLGVGIGGNALLRYSSASEERTVGLQLDYGGSKFAGLTSFSFTKLGDITSGKSKNPFKDYEWLNNEYVINTGLKDSVVLSDDPYKQIFTGYDQFNINQKLLFQANKLNSFTANIQYSKSSDIPRFDRLSQRVEGVPRFAEWSYGPQERILAAIGYEFTPANSSLFDKLTLTPYYQKIVQERITRRLNRTARNTQTETVNIFGVNLDLNKDFRNGWQHFSGIQYTQNDVKSVSNDLDIYTNVSKPAVTRYPPGKNATTDMGIFTKWQYSISNWVLEGGLRYQYNSLTSEIGDSMFFLLSIPGFEQKLSSLSGSLGAVYKINNQNDLKVAISNGFRAPNLDDLAKIFESVAGSVIIPNTDLKAEKAYNIEIGWEHRSKNTLIQITPFYTKLKDAIVTQNGSFNGKDSIEYLGVVSKILQQKNANDADIYGVQFNIRLQLSGNWSLEANTSYTYGRYHNNKENLTVPLDHIPPLFGILGLNYKHSAFDSGLRFVFNGDKKLADYSPSGEDNLASATPDGTPAWFTANIYAGYQYKAINLQLACDNLLDTHYRTFASGINGLGRNFKVTLRTNF